MTAVNVVWIWLEAIVTRSLIDQGQGRGPYPIGWRCLTGFGLTILTGCAAQSSSTDPLDVAKSTDLHAAAAPPAASQPGLSGGDWNEFGALSKFGGAQAGIDRLKAPDGMNGPFAARQIRAVEAEVASVSEAEQLQNLQAVDEAGQRLVRRSVNDMTFGLPDHLDRVAGGREAIEAELARTREAGAQAAAAWLENRRERISTMRFADGRVVFGFKGSTNPAEPSAGPSLSADLGDLERLPANISVGVDLGRETPGLAAFSDTVEAAEGFAHEQQQTFGLDGAPIGSGLDPDAAGRLRVGITDRDGGDLKWWLFAGLEQGTSLGAQPVDDLAGAQPMDIDAGVQYELGPEFAVSAAYGYRGSPDLPMDSLNRPVAPQGSDEQLHSASLRLIWRFVPADEPAKKDRADGE